MVDPLLDTPLIQSIGWALIHFVWQGTAIGIATALALRALAGARPTLRYAVACFSLALMLIVPVVAVLTDRASSAMPVAATVATSADFVPPVPLDRLLPSAVIVWLAGVLLLSARLLVSFAAVERLKRATRSVDATVVARVQSLAHRFGIARPVRVFESARVHVPTVVGYLRPVILLPASVITGLAPAYLDAVLAHELAHVRRHDYLVNVLQSLVETLLFYHPAVWWCSRQIRIEREHCCDDMVVEAGGNRVTYAAALTQLEELRGLQPMLSLNASGGRLLDRIRRLLGESPVKERRSTTWTIAAALTVVTAIIVAPALTVAKEGEPAVSLPEPQPVPQPQVQPRPEPAPRPQAPQARQSQAQPRQPQAQPAQQPQAQPKPQPVAQPAPQPRPQPPLPPTPPALPAPASVSAPPAPPAPAPTAPAPPVPPAPPAQAFGLDPDSLQEILNSARQEIAESLEELRRATDDVVLKQETIRQAQAEIAKMRLESLATKAEIDAMQKALADFSAKGAAKAFDSREMQKLLDELSAEISKLRVR